jgi:uncharacterized protein (TIGR00661 family)
MKVLYALQATGNGHISRANVLVPELRKYCTVDVLISGTQADLALQVEPKYRLKGFSLATNRNGGVSYRKTLKLFHPLRFHREMRSINLDAYDAVVNDFEPISAWACRLSGKPCIALSHQYSLTQPGVPLPEKASWFFMQILKYYAPCKSGIGFHFESYNSNILPPIIRKSLRASRPVYGGHYSVYLPAYGHKHIADCLTHAGNIRWHIFSREVTQVYTSGNCTFLPVVSELFTQSLLSCDGIICGAGFETPAEALFLGKKLLVIPMTGQYEQECNAAALAALGHTVIPRLETRYIPRIAAWTMQAPQPPLRFETHYPLLWNRLDELMKQQCTTSLKKTTAQDYAVVQV